MVEITPTEREELESIINQVQKLKASTITTKEYHLALKIDLLPKYDDIPQYENDNPQKGVYIRYNPKIRTFMFVSGNYGGIERNEPTYLIETNLNPPTFYRSALSIGEVYSPQQSSQEFVVVANELEAFPNDDKLANYLFLALARSELAKKE